MGVESEEDVVTTRRDRILSGLEGLKFDCGWLKVRARDPLARDKGLKMSREVARLTADVLEELEGASP